MSLIKSVGLNVYVTTLMVLGLFASHAYALQDVTITKSPHDNRAYRGIYLDNGLTVLLVSDPDADKAAVALNVEVGSFNEPSARNGLAHFLEHMLFLGTEKYPNPNEYSKFITEHGGMNNAWTGSRNTQYYYTILPQYLPESLDRFSQFFIAPLFNKDLVDRERHAVDSEYHLSLKKDGWRINEVSNITANPQHPISRFSIGNLQTLGDDSKLPPIRSQLVDFYNNNYSADRMTLAIVAPESLDDLEKLAQQYFNPLAKRKVVDNAIPTLAYTSHETAERIMIQTLGDYQELSMEFPIPSQKEQYNYKSIDYIFYLIQQTGPDSLYQLLKNKNWISGIAAGTDDTTTKQDIVNLTFSLTPEGLKNMNAIIGYTFNYIYYLRDLGPQQAIFDELRSAGERNFTYADRQDPLDYVAALPTAMHKYPLVSVLRAAGFSNDSEYNPAHIKDLFKYLIPENLRVYIVNPKVKGNKYEKYYQVNYKIEKFSKKELEQWSKRDPKVTFALPTVNAFMPQNFNVMASTSVDLSDQLPEKIVADPGVTAWFIQNKRFLMPSVDIMLQLQAPNMTSTPRRTVLAKFMVASLDDKLSNLGSQFALAGVNETDDVDELGLYVGLNMFSDKMADVAQKILEYIQDYKVNSVRFGSYKDDIKRELLNFKQQHPYKQAAKITYACIYKPLWLPEDLLKEIDSITIQEIESYTQEFLNNVQLVALLNGNIDAVATKDLIARITASLKINTTRAAVGPAPQIVTLKNGSNYYYQFNPYHNDGVIVSYHQCQTLGDKSIAANLLLVDILDQPLFDQLRTKEQLGYAVGVNAARVREQTGTIFYIEASKQQPTFLQQRLDSFLLDFKSKLQNMATTEFGTYQSSLEAVLLQKPNSLSEETARYWSKILEQSYRFNFEKEIAAEVHKLQLNDVQELYNAMWIDPQQQRVVSVISQQKSVGNANMQEIKSIAEFKAEQVYN